METYPSGEVTFLFTDIEGSTRLWEQDAAAMWRALERHHTLLRAAIRAHAGVPFKTIGDAFQAAFAAAPNAIAAAVDAQRALATADWPETGPIRVRMALHVGEARPDGGDYTAPCLNRLARLLSTGFGGQVLLTDAVRQLVAGHLPEGVALVDLGRHRLRDLLEPELVAQLAIAGLPATFPPLKSLERRPTNLPVQPTELIGRDVDLAELKALVTERGVRLVTLTGPGGTGKTRLALQAAADLLDRYDDGAFFVDLSAVADQPQVLPAIAQTLGVREAGGRTLREALVGYLEGKRLLLVLDNFEQVVGAASVVADLLTASADLTVLATSREALRLRAEREFAVAPLATPPLRRLPPLAELAHIPAVDLFVRRAAAAKRGFALTAENARAVAEICARLDGLPLAIELAAARTRLLGPAALLERLGDRLKLLTGGARDLPARQQTLRAAIEWSHDLLSPNERTLFRRLGVFAGGCTLEAAEAVAGGHEDSGTVGQGGRRPISSPPVPLSPSALDEIASLVDKSLLRQEEQPDGEPRFRMLETIRSYALERLDTSDEAEDVRQAHAAHFLMLAEEAAPELVGPRQIAWLDRLDTDHDNLRLTLEHFASRDDASLLRLAAALWRFWRIRGYLTEGRQWLERALAARSDDTATRLVALTGAGELARAQADYARAQDWFENGLALAEQTGGAASADFLNNLGTVAIARGNLLEAKHRLEACLARLETIGDRRRMAIALNNLGAIDQYRGDRASATARYEECLAMCRSVGDDRGIAETLFNLLSLVAAVPEEGAHARRLGEEALAMCRVLGDRQGEALALAELAVVSETGGNLARACELYEESLSLFREIGDRGGVARNLGSLGMVALRMDDSARALALCGEGLRINAELGEREGVAAGLEEMAIVALSRGNHLHAVRWFAAADAIRTDIETPASPSRQTLLDDAMRTLKGEVDTVEFATTWGTGRTMGDDQAVREALSALPSAPFVTTAASGGLHPRPVAPTDLVR